MFHSLNNQTKKKHKMGAGSSSFDSPSSTASIKRHFTLKKSAETRSAPTLPTDPVSLLENDIKTYADYNTLLKHALVEVEKYFPIVDGVCDFNAVAFEKAMTKDVADLLKMSKDKLGLVQFVYDREHGSSHNDKLLLAFCNNISVMSTIHKFVDGFYGKTGDERKSYHGPLKTLKNSSSGDWFSTSADSDPMQFIRFCAYMNGNNQIYIDLLEMFKGWLSFIEKVPCDHPDTDLLAEVKRYSGLHLEKIEFKPLNQFMADTVYGSTEYQNVFGEAQLYFYIVGNNFNVDVSHKLFDEDKTRMTELMESKSFDVKSHDPLNKNWRTLHKKTKLKGSLLVST